MSLYVVTDLKSLEIKLAGTQAREVMAELEPCVYDLARMYRVQNLCGSWPEALRVAWNDLKLMVRPS